MTSSLSVDIVIRIGAFERSISFRAAPGITALVGPSGCGKTTALNCIAGLMEPKSGRVIFNDELWFDSSARLNMPPQRRRPGYVFQNVALFPHLDVSANVLFGINDKPEALQQQRLQNLAEIFGLGELLKRKPSMLSGGQAQRVAIARALAPAPRLLLLDEPLNALDRSSRNEIAASLAQMQSTTGMTVIFVTHFLEENTAFANSVVDLSQS